MSSRLEILTATCCEVKPEPDGTSQTSPSSDGGDDFPKKIDPSLALFMEATNSSPDSSAPSITSQSCKPDLSQEVLLSRLIQSLHECSLTLKQLEAEQQPAGSTTPFKLYSIGYAIGRIARLQRELRHVLQQSSKRCSSPSKAKTPA